MPANASNSILVVVKIFKMFICHRTESDIFLLRSRIPMIPSIIATRLFKMKMDSSFLYLMKITERMIRNTKFTMPL